VQIICYSICYNARSSSPITCFNL